MRTDPGPPVVVATSSPHVADTVARLAAAVHVEMVVVADVSSVRNRWADAAVVLVDDDTAQRLGPAPTRRDGVVLLSDSRSAATLESALSLGAERVVMLPDDEAWLVERLVSAGGEGRDGLVVGLVSMRGGAGASTTATALARYAVGQRMSAVVVDADPWGGGVEVMTDVTDEPGLRWSDLRGASGRLPADALAGALPTRHGVAAVVQDCDPDEGVPSPDALASVTQALRRAYDLVLVDLPRSRGSLRSPAVAGGALLLVTTNDVHGARVAQRASAQIDVHAVPSLVVRTGNRSGVEPTALARACGIRLAATVRHDRRVAADQERGDFVMRASLRRSSRTLLHDLAGTRGVMRR